MEAAGYKVFNDSVHGHITLHPLLVKVVDTPQFQRLRNLKQLGLAYYVFPGAGHCRFEHSLGTCYLAGQMVEKLMTRTGNREPEEVTKLSLCVQLAALCHDLGHGAFSHTWERVTKRWGYDWKHEDTSIQLFDYLVKENKLETEFKQYGLEKHERDIVKQLIMGGPYEGSNQPLLSKKNHFLYEIVSNKRTGVDVDKWDYFLRDGLHLNLRITFDYRRLLEFCTVLEDKNDQTTRLAFRDKEMMNLYDMYRVRSALHHTAYKHRVVMNIELMCTDAFVLAGDAGYKLNSRCPLKDAHKSPENMQEMTDHVFYDLLYSQGQPLAPARELLERVLRRDLYRFVGKVNVQLPETDRQKHIEGKKIGLEAKLSIFPNLKFCVTDIFVDLDSQNDPVSKVSFYQKGRGTNEIEEQQFENIQGIMDPFPFKLTTQATAQLLVFCKTQGVSDSQLNEPQQIISSFTTT